MKDTIFTIHKPSIDLPYTVDEALDIIGRGRFQYYVFISCGIFLLATIVETLGVAYIITPAECELELDTFRKGLLSSVTFLGIAVSSHVSGFITDEFGRKKTVFISLTISMVISATGALIPDYWTIVVLRLLSGMSISAASSGIYAYMSEFFPANMRASAIMFGSAVASASALFMPFVGLVVNRYGWHIPVTDTYTITGWRLQLFINLIPGVISLFFMRKLPESPKFLMSVNREEECLRVLRRMYEKNTGESRFRFPVKHLKMASDQLDNGHSQNRSLKGFFSAIAHETALIFKPPHLSLILSCCFIQFGCFVIAGGFGLWFPELSNRMSQGTPDSGFCEIIRSTAPDVQMNVSAIIFPSKCLAVIYEEMYINNMFLGCGYIVSFSLLALGLNKISLKSTLTSMLIVVIMCAFSLQHVLNGTILLVVFCVFVIGCGVSIPLVNATAVDLFPTNLRGMAISMSILIGRMGTVAGANSIGFLLDLNCGYTFYGLGVLAMACAILSAYIPKKNYKESSQS